MELTEFDKEILSLLKSRGQIKQKEFKRLLALNDTRCLRKSIEKLRIIGEPIGYDNAGYFYTDSPTRLLKTAQNYYSRAMSELHIAKTLMNTAERMS